ncbi:hypothetical protein ACQP2F_14475 [Actinoplanes sp. CA-030573]|uniref:hypothetical protein n=1 Tax=Actinoplanes sp. CA-030573 TaxID=3239898 RepID=UPI003D8BDF4A
MTDTFTFLRITADGDRRPHHRTARTGSERVQALRIALGGEPLHIAVTDRHLSVWCAPRAYLAGRAHNPVATAVVTHLGGRPPEPLAGPVVIAGRRGADSAGLTRAQLSAVLQIVDALR